jgi:hypothetical protein
MKQKRKSQAGRKPAGPFAHNTGQLTIRMPDDLRFELERSANKKGWSLTQELLWRVRSSYMRRREEERRTPATRALCFLIGEIAQQAGLTISEWHRCPFAFRAFRLAAARLLEALEPPGDLQNPYDDYEGLLRGVLREDTLMANEMAASLKTPESLADAITGRIMHELLHPHQPGWEESLRELRLRGHPEGQRLADYLLDSLYGMSDVRRDLGIPIGELDEAS